jgi:putative membrane protein
MGIIALLWVLAAIIFWALVVFLIIWAIRKLAGRSSSDSRRTSLDILDERYAKGEITREQYEQMKRDLLR